MTTVKEKVRIDVSNYDPTEAGDGVSVAYHFDVDDTERILDFMRVNIDAGMYLLIYPWWRGDEGRKT